MLTNHFIDIDDPVKKNWIHTYILHPLTKFHNRRRDVNLQQIKSAWTFLVVSYQSPMNPRTDIWLLVRVHNFNISYILFCCLTQYTGHKISRNISFNNSLRLVCVYSYNIFIVDIYMTLQRNFVDKERTIFQDNSRSRLKNALVHFQAIGCYITIHTSSGIYKIDYPNVL